MELRSTKTKRQELEKLVEQMRHCSREIDDGQDDTILLAEAIESVYYRIKNNPSTLTKYLNAHRYAYETLKELIEEY